MRAIVYYFPLEGNTSLHVRQIKFKYIVAVFLDLEVRGRWWKSEKLWISREIYERRKHQERKPQICIYTPFKSFFFFLTLNSVCVWEIIRTEKEIIRKLK